MTLRWGIVAAGLISQDFVNAFTSYPDIGDQVIAAVAARDKSRAEEFAKTFNIKKVFSSYEEMAESKDIDIAYIGTLNPSHYFLSKLFLENGKHVLCEKPLCMNFKQAQSLVNLARKQKLFLMEAVWSRCAPTYELLEKEIKSGKLGNITRVDATFGTPADTVERLRKRDLGGSNVLDMGVYVLQFAQFVFKDEPTKVTAIGNLNEDGVDMVATIVLEYTGGRRALLNIDAKAKLWNKASVYGTEGQATVDEPFHFPDVFINSEGKEEKITLHTSKIPYNFVYNSAGLVYEALEVARCIKAGLLESPRMSHNDSLILANLQDTIRKQLGVYFDIDNEEYV